jgi:hypothetical protein
MRAPGVGVRERARSVKREIKILYKKKKPPNRETPKEMIGIQKAHSLTKPSQIFFFFLKNFPYGPPPPPSPRKPKAREIFKKRPQLTHPPKQKKRFEKSGRLVKPDREGRRRRKEGMLEMGGGGKRREEKKKKEKKKKKKGSCARN